MSRRFPEPLDAALALLGTPAGAAHWSDDDWRRLDRLLPAHPVQRWAAADELARLAGRLGEAGGALQRVAVPGRLGDRATQYCAPIAAALDAVVGEATRLLGDLRASAHRAEQLLAELVSVAHQVRGEPPVLVSRALRDVLEDHERPGHRGALEGWDQPASDSWAQPPGQTVRLEPGAGPSVRPEPGAGPTLGGTDGERPTTDIGVRVAQLPATGAPG